MQTEISPRWHSVAWIVISCAAIAIEGCSPATIAPEDQTVRVCLQPIPAYAPLWVAKRKGWLQDELSEKELGRVEWSTMRDGPLQNEAFAAGLIDVALTADTPAIIGRSAGLEFKVVGLIATCPQSLAVLVPKDSSVKNMADLKGKKIAATKGSFCHHLLALALQREGMSLADVRFINMSGPEINTSLQSGHIDAGVTWEPYISQMIGSGSAKVLLDGTGLKNGNEVIVATNRLIETSPQVIDALLEVAERGKLYIAEYPSEAASLISDDVGMPPEQLVGIFSKNHYLPPIDVATTDELDATQAFLHDLGVNRNKVDINQFVEMKFQDDHSSEVEATP
ncbi:aliphatic sulfonate ABC transporter substrate-binding protein [Bremerella cremea]|uniref:aliphatic sulfonate ABC transporter substrate-binding protein n=1 Tax=Bremerella cremea TaxID=1031537 RepID=UPI0031E5BA82